MKRGLRVLRNALILTVVLFTTGCTVFRMEEEKIQELDYVIVNEAQQPLEVQFLIEENKENDMKMSYTDQGEEYIIIGYGEQKTSGYSVEIESVYETEDTVHVVTNLIGPRSDESIVELATYPYVVICIEENKKTIMYD